MDAFYITPDFAVVVGFILLYLTMAGYLVSLRGKTAATWWLALFCASFALNMASWSVQTFLPSRLMEDVQGMMIVGGNVGWFIGFWALIHFSYVFRGNPFPREYRIVSWVSGGIVVGVVGILVVEPSYTFTTSPFIYLFFPTWAAGVFWRKTIRFSNDAVGLSISEGTSQAFIGASVWKHLRQPQGRAARGCRAFLWLSLAWFLVGIFAVFIWVVPVQTIVFGFLFSLSVNLVTVGLLISYVNYTPEPTTVQVKLVGVTLVLMVLLVDAVGYLFPLKMWAREAGLAPMTEETIRYTPNAQGRYAVTRHPLPEENLDPGDPLAIKEGDEVTLPLGFAFPFYDQAWKEATINRYGTVAFGGSLHPEASFTSRHGFYNPVPKVSLLTANLNPDQGGAIYVRQGVDHLTVTWHEVPIQDRSQANTMRLTLYADGRIDMIYEAVSDDFFAAGEGVRGIHPGGVPVLVPLDSAANAASGVAYVEDFRDLMMQHSETTGIPFLGIILFVIGFVLVGFPYFFRASLLRPLSTLLDGVKRVEQGALDTVVAVQVQDELGVLAQHFNMMTYTVREAEQQLKDYAETLEDKVEARTAELAQSLDDLKATQAQLIQAEKMASLGQLTAGIAHEIKNPLNFVNNFSLLSTELADDIGEALHAHRHHLPEAVVADLDELLSDLKLNVTKTYEHGQRADGIVSAMMDHARGGEGERRMVDVNALVEEYVNLAYHGMRANIPGFNVTLQRDYDEQAGEVEMVPQDIGRVLLNLLNNAFYAVYQQGLSRNGQYMPTVTLSTQRVDEAVEIRVVDNGPGIPEGYRKKIFDPFFTTKPAGSGTGLGLSLSYDIVTQGHGGTMTVESTEGKGATFVVTL